MLQNQKKMSRQANPESTMSNGAPATAVSSNIAKETGQTGRKTAMGGALTMGLIASNTDQVLNIITTKWTKGLDALDISKIALLSASLFIQVSFGI